MKKTEDVSRLKKRIKDLRAHVRAAEEDAWSCDIRAKGYAKQVADMSRILADLTYKYDAAIHAINAELKYFRESGVSHKVKIARTKGQPCE